ncbi:hypothetical protein IE53DRAFT_101199 [Violaceomyces palustris]|uniref:Uncharacterized protein n=1 Tax=Violaceomyces palustris TaxID=1673888 RepID=A0ACD0NWU1_9BASI|nr:hypothetical protein IE53DRAFT_101199 [Violaceomyces palustris]
MNPINPRFPGLVEIFLPDKEGHGPLTVRNLDDAPRGSWTPNPGQGTSKAEDDLIKSEPNPKFRNPWASRSEEDDEVDQALAESRSSQRMAKEERAVLDLLDSMDSGGLSVPITNASLENKHSWIHSMSSPPSSIVSLSRSNAHRQAATPQISPQRKCLDLPQQVLPTGSRHLDDTKSLESVKHAPIRQQASYSASHTISSHPKGSDTAAEGPPPKLVLSPESMESGRNPASEDDRGATTPRPSKELELGSNIPSSTIPLTEFPAHGNEDRRRPHGFNSSESSSSSSSSSRHQIQHHDRVSFSSSASSSRCPTRSIRGLVEEQNLREVVLSSPMNSASSMVTSPNDDPANGFWSRPPTNLSDTPLTSHDPCSPLTNSPTNEWEGMEKTFNFIGHRRRGYSVTIGVEGSNTGRSIPPTLRRHGTDWTEATSVSLGDQEEDQIEKGKASDDTIRSGQGGNEFEEARKGSRQCPLTIAPISAWSGQPRSAPPSPTKAKDLIRFFEGANSSSSSSSSTTISNPQTAKSREMSTVKSPLVESNNNPASSNSISPPASKAKGRFPTSSTIHHDYGERKDENILLKDPTVTMMTPPTKLLFQPLHTEGVQRSTSPPLSPLARKIRRGLRVHRSGIGVGVVGGGGGGEDMTSGDFDGLNESEGSSDENTPPPLASGPANKNQPGNRPSVSGGARVASGRFKQNKSSSSSPCLPPGRGLAFQPGTQPSPCRFSSSPTKVFSRSGGGGETSLLTTESGQNPGVRGDPNVSGGPPPSLSDTEDGGSKAGVRKNTTALTTTNSPFRKGVRSIVNSISNKSSSNPAPVPPAPPSSSYTFKSVQKSSSSRGIARENDGKGLESGGETANEETWSLASRGTMGTTLSYRHRIERFTEEGEREERGTQEAEKAAIRISGEPPWTKPIRTGIVLYFNVHHESPHWQRVQAVLLPSSLAMSWIPNGGGRENVALDLKACREVHSVPSPEHPCSSADLGAIAAKRQGLKTLNPFQLIFDDGVERLAAESASERVRWVASIWDVIGVIDSGDPSTLTGKKVDNLGLGKSTWVQGKMIEALKRSAEGATNEGGKDIGEPNNHIPSFVESRQDQSLSRALGIGPPVPPKDGSTKRIKDTTGASAIFVGGGDGEGLGKPLAPPTLVSKRKVQEAFVTVEEAGISKNPSEPAPTLSSQDTPLPKPAAEVEKSPLKEPPPPRPTQDESANEPSSVETSPDMEDYESALSHSSPPVDMEEDDFGPRTPPLSEAVFKWIGGRARGSKEEEGSEIDPNDSASQRPARSQVGSVVGAGGWRSRRDSIEARKGSSPLRSPTWIGVRAPPPTERGTVITTPSPLVEEKVTIRTPAQMLRDSVLGEQSKIEMESQSRAQPFPRLGTVVEETKSQTQSSSRGGRDEPYQVRVAPVVKDVEHLAPFATSGGQEFHSSSSSASAADHHPSDRSQGSLRSDHGGSSNSNNVSKLLDQLEQKEKVRDQATWRHGNPHDLDAAAAHQRTKSGENLSRSSVDASSNSSTTRMDDSQGGSNSQRSRRIAPFSSSSYSPSRGSSLRRDEEMARMQEKLDRMIDLLNDVVQGQVVKISERAPDREINHQSSAEGLERIQATLERLLERVQEGNEAFTGSIPASSVFSGGRRSLDPFSNPVVGDGIGGTSEQYRRRLLSGSLRDGSMNLDGRHQAMLTDLTKVHPIQTQRLQRKSAPSLSFGDLQPPPDQKNMMSCSTSMSEVDSLTDGGRIPARSWVSEQGIPSPPPNTEWDAKSHRTRVSASETATDTTRTPSLSQTQSRTPARDLRLHGQPEVRSVPIVTNSVFNNSRESLDMEAEVRRRRTTLQGSKEGSKFQPGGWYRSKADRGSPAAQAENLEPTQDGDEERPMSVRDGRGGNHAGSIAQEGFPRAFGNAASGLGLTLLPPEDRVPSPRRVGMGREEGDDLGVEDALEMSKILQALRRHEASRQDQQRQQADIARYLNELNLWLEKDVSHRSNEWRALASGVSRLHQELQEIKIQTGGGKGFDNVQPSAGGEGPGTMPMPVPMPIPLVRKDQVMPGMATGEPSKTMPWPPPTPLRPSALPSKFPHPGAGATATVRGLAFADRGETVQLGGQSPARRPRNPTRTWHASPTQGQSGRNQVAWYRPEAVEEGQETKGSEKPRRKGSFRSKMGKAAAVAGGALLIRAAIKEWEKHRDSHQQQLQRRPAGGGLDERVRDGGAQPFPPEEIPDRIKVAADSGDEEKVKTIVREAAKMGLGKVAVDELSEHLGLKGDEDLTVKGEDGGKDSDAETLRGEGVEETKSSRLSRSYGEGKARLEKSQGDDAAVPGSRSLEISDPAGGERRGGPSNQALALAVEEILKHLLDRKEEEKRKREEAEREEASRRAKELEKERSLLTLRERDKAEMVDMILTRLNQEKARREAEISAKQKELDPKSAIESLVAAINSQKEKEYKSQAEADKAIKEMAKELLKETSEQNKKLLEAIHQASKEMTSRNVDLNHQTEEIKRNLTKEIGRMLEDVGKIGQVKRSLENEISELFLIKSKHLSSYDGVKKERRMLTNTTTTTTTAIPAWEKCSNDNVETKAKISSTSSSPSKKEGGKQPHPPNLVRKDFLNPLSVNFGPRKPNK